MEDCVFQIPSLLQLCAERVASDANKYKRMHHYFKLIQLPKVRITYIENNLYYKTCDFSTYIKEKTENTTVMSMIPSVAKGRENNKIKITVGNENVMYISTISDLGYDMLKLDFPEGEYELYPFDDGYVLKTKDYSPRIQDAKHVFNSHDGDKGLAGTYPQACVENVQHLRIFNQYISEYLPNDWWGIITKTPFRKVLTSFLDEYINIPVFFYLTKSINVDDLNKITLTCPTAITNCGNVTVCWYVHHPIKGRIGIAVQQEEFFDLMGDQAGVCLFASKGFRAIGNFDYDHNYNHYDNMNADVFEVDQNYECEFKQCFCDYIRNE